MRYFLDTEFNGFGGELISLAMVREDGASLYLIYGLTAPLDPFVRDHVQPKLMCVPAGVDIRQVSQADGARAIEAFLHGDADPEIFADWPDDVRLFCHALMIAAGRTAQIDRLGFKIRRVEPYPTDLAGVVEHNSWWDAMALRQRLKPETQP